MGNTNYELYQKEKRRQISVDKNIKELMDDVIRNEFISGRRGRMSYSALIHLLIIKYWEDNEHA